MKLPQKVETTWARNREMLAAADAGVTAEALAGTYRLKVKTVTHILSHERNKVRVSPQLDYRQLRKREQALSAQPKVKRTK